MSPQFEGGMKHTIFFLQIIYLESIRSNIEIVDFDLYNFIERNCYSMNKVELNGSNFSKS